MVLNIVLIIAGFIIGWLMADAAKRVKFRKPGEVLLPDVKYDANLAARFVDDCKYPISITNDRNLFIYQLALFDKSFGTLKEWESLWKTIDMSFGGNPAEFLQQYYNIRDRIITETEKSEAFKAFNSADLKKYAVEKHEGVSSKNVYNDTNIGHSFLSIDLKKANFQAIYRFDPKIVRNAETYEDFIGLFTNLDYVRKSKYTRQVIFGKMNPSRQITIEKWLTEKVLKVCKDLKNLPIDMKSDKSLVCLCNDEIVLNADSDTFLWNKTIKRCIEDDIMMETGINVSAEAFKLHGYCLVSKKTGHQRATFYVKEFINEGRENKFVSVPGTYYPIVYKLYNKMKLEERDMHFIYEKIDCIFNDDFVLMTVEDYQKFRDARGKNNEKSIL